MNQELKAASKGLVWVVVGVLVHVISSAMGYPLVVRGTSIPWGLVVAGVGVVIAIAEVVKLRRS